MSVIRLSDVCDGARAQISRRLDGELSQLEERMLETHLDKCSDCRGFAADISVLTTEIRTAPLEQLGHAIVIRRPRSAFAPGLRVGAAAAVAVAMLGALLQVATSGSGSSAGTSFRSPTEFGSLSQVQSEVRQIAADGKAFKRHDGGDNWAT